MRVFVTGASGHIGSAVVPELLGAGHHVLGLARSDAAAEVVAASGAEVVRGSIEDLEGLAAAAATADGVIHLAFNHEFNDLARAAISDLAAVKAIGEALVGSDKPFVMTSGTLILAFAAPGKLGTEDVVLPSGPRADSENFVIGLASQGVRSSAIRLAPLVHSTLDHHGFTHRLIEIARRTGVSAYVGEGSNRWAGLHTLDAATLYLAALEHASAGARFHGVEDEGVPFREIAEILGRHLDLPTRSIAPEEADGHFGFLGHFAALDAPVSNAWTRETLGWEPTHEGLRADLAQGHYFADVK